MVPKAIIEGVRPTRPPDFRLTEPLWNLTHSCWVGTAKDRPEMEDVVGKLEVMSVHLHPSDGLLTHFHEALAMMLHSYRGN